MTQAERDVAEEDYESRKEDIRVKDQWAAGAGPPASTSSATPKVRRSTDLNTEDEARPVDGTRGAARGGPSLVLLTLALTRRRRTLA